MRIGSVLPPDNKGRLFTHAPRLCIPALPLSKHRVKFLILIGLTVNKSQWNG
jgi:hypothetical protein